MLQTESKLETNSGVEFRRSKPPLFPNIAQALFELPSLLEKRSFFKRETYKSKHPHWQLEPYFKIAQQDERYQEWWKLNSLVKKDFFTFTDEAVIPRYKTGPYNYTPTGLPYSYKDESEVYSTNFINQQKATLQPLSENRAGVESKKWKELEAWLYECDSDRVPVGQIFIWFSPRGSVEEGYLGKEPTNPNLLSVYIKTSRGVEMTQYKTWSTLKQLKSTILDLGYTWVKNGGDTSHNCINSSGVCKKTNSLEEIEAVIYKSEFGDQLPNGDTQAPWPVTRDHLPVVDLQKFELYRKETYDAYSRYLVDYLVASRKTTQDNTKVKQFLDIIFSITIKTLEGWVYHNDQRSDNKNTYKTVQTVSANSDQSITDTTISHATPGNVNRLLMLLFYNIECMIFHPEKITLENILTANQILSTLMLNIPDKLFSLGQCIAMAPISIVAAPLKKFTGGLLPTDVVVKEGWLYRKGVCARGTACISDLKGEIQNLGPCNWCFACDGRFGHIRALSKIDHKLFKKSTKATEVDIEQPVFTNPKRSSRNFSYQKKSKSINLTQFLAGDYVTT